MPVGFSDQSTLWLFVEDDCAKVCESLKALKQRICQYGAPFGQRCDCKYGPYGVGEASGCAEVTMVIAGIEAMTDLQWQRFLKGWGVKLAGNGKVLSAPKGK